MAKIYIKIRPYLFTTLLIVTFIVIGGLLYKEWVTPVALPKVNDIAATPPPAQPQPTATSSVPPHHPKHITIPSISVSANVEQVGTVNGRIDAPKTAWNVGWFNKSAQPGNKGAMVLDGHVNDLIGTPGIFYDLHKLKVNDAITITKGDDTVFNYRVVSTEQLPLNKLDMNKVLAPIETETEGLNIITCGGTYDKAKQTYSERVVVYAKRI